MNLSYCQWVAFATRFFLYVHALPYMFQCALGNGSCFLRPKVIVMYGYSHTLQVYFEIYKSSTHPFADKFGIALYKADDAVVVFGIGIAYTSALQNFHLRQRNFYRFYPFPINGG